MDKHKDAREAREQGKPERVEREESREQPESEVLLEAKRAEQPERAEQQVEDQHQPTSRATRVAALIFCLLVLGLALAPFVGMVWAPTASTTENRELATLPAPVGEDGAVNLNYLPQLGEWFEDHFAGRNELVAVNARIRADVFGVSANDQVIVGSDGWLYYAGTISDYVGTSPLSERELRCIAHNLSFMQAYTEAQGAQFAFTIAPNKNSLYPEHMPALYLAATEPSNAQRLALYLKEYGVTTVDLFSVLGDAKAGGGVDADTSASPGTPDSTGSSGASDALYLLGDTHWNNRGALIADTALSKALGITPLPSGEWIERDDAVGDLDRMLFPGLPTPERQYYRAGINDGPGFSGSSWSYRAQVSDAATEDDAEKDDDETDSDDAAPDGGAAPDTVEASLSQTEGKGTGTLVMYRDSFGNALLPYLATQTKEAEFSKRVPYNVLRIVDLEADFVLVERAERHLDYLARNAPIMPCPTVPLDTAQAKTNMPAQASSTCEQQDIADVLVSFGGVIDPRVVEDDSLIYVSLEQVSGDGALSAPGTSGSALTGERVYEAFLLSPEGQEASNGYLVSIPKTVFSPGNWSIKVFVTQGDTLFLVQSTTHQVSSDKE